MFLIACALLQSAYYEVNVFIQSTLYSTFAQRTDCKSARAARAANEISPTPLQNLPRHISRDISSFAKGNAALIEALGDGFYGLLSHAHFR